MGTGNSFPISSGHGPREQQESGHGLRADVSNWYWASGSILDHMRKVLYTFGIHLKEFRHLKIEANAPVNVQADPPSPALTLKRRLFSRPAFAILSPENKVIFDTDSLTYQPIYVSNST